MDLDALRARGRPNATSPAGNGKAGNNSAQDNQEA